MRRLAVLGLVLFAGCPGPAATPTPAPKPIGGSGVSVLLITIDTLRADHLGVYGYARPTSPHIDAFAKRATVFDQAYTFWPKTRGSFVMLHTGRRPSQNGYSKAHPMLLDFNPTIASVLQAAGYRTAATVDNPNVAKNLGYAKGFAAYRETWEEPALASELDRTRAITADGVRFLKEEARATAPFFLWLHYVNPHAPYTPPAPFDTAFTAGTDAGPRLPVVDSFHGGIPKQWRVPGRDRKAWYVAQYDGEIAAVDAEVGQVLAALEASGARDRTLVIVTSDHGESLGEHDYYFDHGENLFDPCLRIPLMIAGPGAAAGRRDALASTLDLFPTILDAAKVSWPPDLAGESLLGAGSARARLFAQNERSLSASFDRRFKVVATPGDAGARIAFYDRETDAGETRDLAPAAPAELRPARRELELFLERADREWSGTRVRIGDAPGEGPMTHEQCEKLRALGYVSKCAP